MLQRVGKYVTRVLGPVAVIVVLFWSLPFIIELVDAPQIDAPQNETIQQITLSSLTDESVRRGTMPFLTRSRAFGGPSDFQELVLFADIVGEGQLVVIGERTVTLVDVQSGAVGPPVMDVGDRLGSLSSVTMTSESQLWIRGAGGLAQLDSAVGDFSRIVILDAEARDPMWLGSQVVATGRDTVFRFYELDENAVAAVDEVGDLLFSGVPPGLSVSLNRMTKSVHPEEPRIAVAFQLSDRLHIYDGSGNLLRAIAGPVDVKLEFDVLRGFTDAGGYRFGISQQTRFSYLDVDSDSDRIVALFAGRSYADGVDSLAGDELHVFRWDGTFVGAWRLPETVVSIRLDEGGQRVYAVREQPFWSVVEFDASPLYQIPNG